MVLVDGGGPASRGWLAPGHNNIHILQKGLRAVPHVVNRVRWHEYHARGLSHCCVPVSYDLCTSLDHDDQFFPTFGLVFSHFFAGLQYNIA